MNDNLNNQTEDNQVDQMVADQEAFDNMMANNRARRLMADTNPADQPKVTDFTEIVSSITSAMGVKGELFAVRILLDGGFSIKVTPWVPKVEAERLELAIHQVMIEYRTKRNQYEQELTQGS